MSMSLSPVDNHESEALGMLAAQFEPAVKLRALVSALAGRVQVLERLVWDLVEDRLFERAEGVQLDVLGELVGQARLGGETDPMYRKKLQAAMLRNRSSGTGDELMAIAVLVTGALSAQVVDSPPAGFVLGVLVTGPLSADEQQALVDYMLEAKKAGVGISGLAWWTGPVFGFAEDPDPNVGPLDDGTGLAGSGTFAEFFWP